MSSLSPRHIKVAQGFEPRRSQFGQERRFPALRLAGLWLAAAGFAAGDQVEITVESGRLVVQHPTPAPGLPTRAQVEALRAIIGKPNTR